MPGDRFLELVSASDRRVLDALFRHAREGVTIQGREGLVYANDRAAQLIGLETGADMLATSMAEIADRFEMIDEDRKPFPLDQLPGRVVLNGGEAPEVTIGYRLSGSGQVRWSRLNASPIKNDTGDVVWALNFFLDITPQIAQRDRERLLNRITEALAPSMHLAPNLSALTNILVPEIAGWCGFHILNEYDELEPSAVAVPETRDAHALLDSVEGPIPRDSDRLPARVLASGVPLHIPKITEEMLEDAAKERGREFADLIRRLDLGAVLCVPLLGGPLQVGTMSLLRAREEGPFEPAELALIDEIALRAGVALANARVFEREHQTAEALRKGLRPEELIAVTGLETAARYLPMARQGHVGGDFYDLIERDGRVYAMIGDIEGKGVEAAAAVGLVRQTLRTTIALDPSPDAVFRQLNEALAAADSGSRMCTLAYVILERLDDGFSGSVSLAGHPPPIILRRDGTREMVGEPVPPAALFDELVPLPQTFELGRGDIMLLYTDGFSLPELTSPETMMRLLDEVPAAQPERLLSDLDDRFHVSVPNPRDDITLFAIAITITPR